MRAKNNIFLNYLKFLSNIYKLYFLPIMGKKQKIRSGAGDVVVLPGPLDKQIEKEKFAKSKIKLQKHINSQQKDEIEEVLI